MAIVIPRSFSSGALSLWSKGAKPARPLAARTLVVAVASAEGGGRRLAGVQPRAAEFDGRKTVVVQGGVIHAAAARGLMGRQGRPEHRRMLFAFRAPTNAPFCRDGTLSPLSLAFFD